MNLPKSLLEALSAADENYLIGLCNKGTVNRAKKDLAELTSPKLTIQEDEIQLQWAEITCHIKAPLGESRCSCPSSGICRHRIAAILWLQQQNKEDNSEAVPPPEEPKFQELSAYPTQKLIKQLGVKKVSAALFRIKSGEFPEMTKTSVITVSMPWISATVRLLEPLEHSTCTCHSKSFCVHKAEALLYWQIQEKAADIDAIQQSIQTENDLNTEEIKGVCQAVQQTLAAQLTTGLCRMPATVCETVERMASLCHTARLPDLERALRRLHKEYSAYFRRSAAYRDTALLQRIAQVFRLAAALENADENTIDTLAGIFREDYERIGNLQLYLLGLREISNNSSYSGTIYYFWERKAHCYYTFNHIRPTFYEKNSRQYAAAVPWGLPCPLKQAWNYSLDLTGAKATRSKTLSSTEECKATLLKAENPGTILPKEEIYTDFARLLAERSMPHTTENQRLAVIRPSRCIPQEYDTVRQMFSMQLLDEADRDLWAEVSYNQTEQKVIEALEKIAEKIEKSPSFVPVFFGIVYRQEDKLKLYPIEVFTDWEGEQ